MTTYLTSTLAADVVKVRWQEPYVTSGLNQKTFGQYAKGVFAGFNVVPSGVALTVELQVDPTLGISGANVLNTSTNNYCVTVVHTDTIDLLLPFSQTVYIVLEAQYQVGATSTAQVRVVDASELSNTELIILAKVNVPAAGVIATSQINMGYRHSAGDAVAKEAQPPFNLLSNGTFERDAIASVPAGWVSSNVGLSVGVSGLLPHTGTGSLHSMVISSGGVISANVASGSMPVIPLDTYRAGAWIRSVSPGDIAVGTASIQVEWLDAAGASISVVSIEAPFSGGSTTWVERKAEVTAPANAATAKLRTAFTGCSGTLYVDDAFFVTRRQDQLTTTSVFGGPTSIADAFHLHSSGTQAYGPGPAWFDGNPNTLTTVSGQLDKIINDLSHATTGTAKIGNAPNKILSNTFTKPNTIASDVANATALSVTGLGTGAAIEGTSGATPAVGVIGVAGLAGGENGFGIHGGVVGSVTDATGVRGLGKGIGPGVYGAGETASAGVGIEGLGGNTGPSNFATRKKGSGVYGKGGNVTGHGVVGQGGSGTTPGISAASGFANVGVLGVGTGSGEGVAGVGGAANGVAGVSGHGSDGVNGIGVVGRGTGTGSGVDARSSGTGNGYGVYAEGSGALPGVYGKSSAYGVQGLSTESTPGTSVGGKFTSDGTGALAFGVVGTCTNGSGGKFSGAAGVIAEGSTVGTGVYASGLNALHGHSTAAGGFGADVYAGIAGAIALQATAITSTGIAIKTRGYIDFGTTGVPLTNDPLLNMITPMSIPKAWAFCNPPGGAGFATVNSGINIGAVSMTAPGVITVFFQWPMADTDYMVTGQFQEAPVGIPYILTLDGVIATTKQVGQFDMVFRASTTGNVLSAAAMSTYRFSFMVFGKQ